MKQTSIISLKILIVFIGVVAFAIMVRFPQTEGRAANLDLISIYTDPVIIYLYIASIAFFVGLYQAFKFLSYVNESKIFSQASVNAVRNIKYCAITIIGFILGAEAFLFVVERGKSDDIAGGVAGGVFIILVFVIIATASAVFEKFLQNGLKTK